MRLPFESDEDLYGGVPGVFEPHCTEYSVHFGNFSIIWMFLRQFFRR